MKFLDSILNCMPVATVAILWLHHSKKS